jgi:hypothetical protein
MIAAVPLTGLFCKLTFVERCRRVPLDSVHNPVLAGSQRRRTLDIDGEGGWRSIHEGESLDAVTVVLPQPVTARRLRLVVTESLRDGQKKFQGPDIQEFDIHAPRLIDDRK